MDVIDRTHVNMKTGLIICGVVLVALMNCGSFVLGQESGFAGNKVTNLTKSDLAGVPNKQVIANIYEVAAGATVPRHSHHGDEFHLVLAGEWAAEVEGRLTKNLKAGESQYVEGGRWHGGKVISSEPLRLLGLMIVDKDKPILEVVK